MRKRDMINKIKELVKEHRVNGILTLDNGDVLFTFGGHLRYSVRLSDDSIDRIDTVELLGVCDFIEEFCL